MHHRLDLIRMFCIHPKMWRKWYECSSRSIRCLRSVNIYIIIPIGSFPRATFSVLNTGTIWFWSTLGTWIPVLWCSCIIPRACKISCLAARSYWNAPQPEDKLITCQLPGAPYWVGQSHPLQRPRVLKQRDSPLWLFVMTIPFLNPDSNVDSSGISSKDKQERSVKDFRLSLDDTTGNKWAKGYACSQFKNCPKFMSIK